MYSTRKHLQEDPDLAEHINYALQEDNLTFTGSSAVRHIIEVLVNDVGLDEIKKKVTKPLKGLRVATYYGCQILRPRKNGDADVEQPTFFEELLSAIGATPVEFPQKMRCCGGSLIVTYRKAALSMVRNLLQSAADHDAQIVATACPLCQINLECYQKQVNRQYKTQFALPVAYFTQLVGLALGFSPSELGFGKEFVPVMPALAGVA
jgi:heterodisulfide reductase subunit B